MPGEAGARPAGRRTRWPALGLAALLAGAGGCPSSDPKVVPLTSAEKALSSVAVAYAEAHEKLRRPPQDPEELKPFLKAFGDPEELLVSPNDGEPYVIVWGADPTRGGPTEYKGMWQILAYERKGKGGKRAVTDVRGRPLTVPAEDFPKLAFVRGHKPAAN